MASNISNIDTFRDDVVNRLDKNLQLATSAHKLIRKHIGGSELRREMSNNVDKHMKEIRYMR